MSQNTPEIAALKAEVYDYIAQVQMLEAQREQLTGLIADRNTKIQALLPKWDAQASIEESVVKTLAKKGQKMKKKNK